MQLHRICDPTSLCWLYQYTEHMSIEYSLPLSDILKHTLSFLPQCFDTGYNRKPLHDTGLSLVKKTHSSSLACECAAYQKDEPPEPEEKKTGDFPFPINVLQLAPDHLTRIW
jgi:hypothetical protein